MTIPALRGRRSPRPTQRSAETASSGSQMTFEAEPALEAYGVHPSRPRSLSSPMTSQMGSRSGRGRSSLASSLGLVPIGEVISESIGEPWFIITGSRPRLDILRRVPHESGSPARSRRGTAELSSEDHLLRSDEVSRLGAGGEPR